MNGGSTEVQGVTVLSVRKFRRVEDRQFKRLYMREDRTYEGLVCIYATWLTSDV